MQRRLKIVLVRPPVDVLQKFSKPVEALGIAYIAAALRLDGHDVRILDAMLYDHSVEETLARIEAEEPDITGFTIVLNHFPDRLVDLLDKMNAAATRGLVVVGGHAVSFFGERVLQHVPRVDAVLSGEGEMAMRLFAAALAAGDEWRNIPGVTSRAADGTIRAVRPERLSLHDLPWPARDMTSEVILRDGVAAISTSRGCYARCSFCSVPRFYGLAQGKPLAAGAWLARDIDDVVAEIEFLKSQFGIRELLIVDDEFFGGTDDGFDRASRFGRAMAERRLDISFAISCRAENVRETVLADLQKGGLSHVFIGIEAGSEASLRLYGKGHTVQQNRDAAAVVKSLGLTFQAGFMMFHPRTTLDHLAESLLFLKDIGEFKPVVINSAVDPHFGAPLLNAFRHDGVLTEDGLKMSVTIADPGVRTVKVIAEAVNEAFQPFMSFIAVTRSSVTFEWRRRVPNRRIEEEDLLDAFEEAVNTNFASVVERGVENLRRGAKPESAVRAALEETASVAEKMRLAQALVIAHLDEVENGIRYWSARCSVDASAAAATL